MVLHHTQRPPSGHITIPPPVNAGSPHHSLPANWTAVFTSLLAEIDRHSRLAAREEFQYLLAAQAEAVAEANKSEQHLTVQQAAEVLCLRPQTVYEWIKAGKLKSFHVGLGTRALRLKRGDVLATLTEQTLPDGRRKYARRANGADKQKRSSSLGE